MDARKLVGMTEGAKKRWARVQYMRATYEVTVCPRAEVLRLFSSWDAAAEKYKYARSMARIGTKLRPCPRCLGCSLFASGFNNFVRWCDGSGVIPAKSKKVRR